jgi:hypothetical protein
MKVYAIHDTVSKEDILQVFESEETAWVELERHFGTGDRNALHRRFKVVTAPVLTLEDIARRPQRTQP